MSEIGPSESSPPASNADVAVPAFTRTARFERIASYGCLTILLLIVIAMLLPPVSSSRNAGRRSQCKNNLKQIGLALHNYHDTYGCFPPAVVTDEHGRPMHSWRVLILPFIDQTPLYNQYCFDEPWDGPNNRKLASAAIPGYNCPSDISVQGVTKSTMTSYVAILGSGTAWPGNASAKFADFKDGLENTILIAEVANSNIHWMEPRDLDLLRMSPTINPKVGRGLSSAHVGGMHVLFADGAVRFLPQTLPAVTIRAFLTIAGGESTNRDDL